MAEEVSFAALYRQHYRRVFALCRRLLGTPDEAEDATQESFARGYRAFDSYDAAQPFAQWIMKIAGNHCVDLIRRRARQAALFATDSADPTPAVSADPGALARLLAAEQADAVARGVQALPERYRIPLLLAYYAECGYDDIASTLGITRTHVATLIFRGKQQLRRSLEQDPEEEK